MFNAMAMNIMNILADTGAGGGGGTTTGSSTTWSIGNALTSLNKSMNSYGKVIMVIIGVAMLIVGIYQVAKNLISHGKTQTNWFITIALIVVGGIFALSSGWSTLGIFVKSANGTVDKLGGGKTGDLADAPEAGLN